MSDLSMTRGDTYEIDLTLSGLASLNGCALIWQARRSYSDTTPTISKALADPPGGITDTSGGGTVSARVTIDPADTSSLTGPTLLVWEAEVTTAGGATYTVAGGTLTVAADVAR